MKGFFRKSDQRARFVLVKYALTRFYPEYPSSGFKAFGNTIPVIIATKPWPFLEEMRFDFGLPLESIVICSGKLILSLIIHK